MAGHLNIGIDTGATTTITINPNNIATPFGNRTTSGAGVLAGASISLSAGSNATQLQFALYTVNGSNDPATLLAYTAAVAVTGSAGVVHADFITPYSAGASASLILAVICNGYLVVNADAASGTSTGATTIATPPANNPTMGGWFNNGILLWATGAAVPTLSAGSPANGTTVGAAPTISCTTDVAPTVTTARIIIDTAAHITGGTPVTGAQVLAGNNNTGSAALYDSGNITAGTTSISHAFSGLAAGSYTWAIAQGSAAVLTGTIIVSTTRSVTIGFNSAGTTALATTAMKFWTRNTKDGAAVDGGSAGLDGTTDASGNITLSGLTILAGARYLQYMIGTDETTIRVIPVTYA